MARMSTGRRVAIGVAAGVAAIALVVGGLVAARELSAKPVPVYAVSDVAQTGFYFGGSTISGPVVADRIQNVYLSDTQTLTELKVAEGDHVQAGDVLATYDTSLTKIEVEKARIAAEKMKLSLAEAEKELDRLQKATTSEGLQSELASLEAQLEQAQRAHDEHGPVYPELPLGDFTEESPRYLELTDEPFSPALLLDEAWELNGSPADEGADDGAAAQALEGDDTAPGDSPADGKLPDGSAGEGAADGAGSNAGRAPEAPKAAEAWVAFVTVVAGLYTDYRGVHLVRDADGVIRESFFTPEELLPEEEQEPSAAVEELQRSISRVQELLAASYSKAQLVAMIEDQQRRIEQLKADVALADHDYRRKAAEMGDGTIVATETGTVKTAVLVPEPGKPAIVVSAGGGMVVQAQVSEFDLDRVHPGDTVSILSWSTGAAVDGIVREVSAQPSGSEQYGYGTTALSTYTATIELPDGTDLVEGDYVEATLADDEGQEDASYLPNMFIRYENGLAYVYAVNEEGLLEKRFINVGSDLWGELTEIRGGLDMTDQLAFPYGPDVRDGAETTPGSLEELMVY